MMMLGVLKRNNPDLTILSFADTPQHALFRAVPADTGVFLAAAESISPEEQNVYIPRDETMNDAAREIERSVFAELPIQVGWNYGGNTRMNGMEWHKSSEVIVACTDLVLLLGDYKDIVADTYESGRAFGLYLQKGETVELFPMTLHLAPLPVKKGRFIAAILLPDGTNLPLSGGTDGTLRAVNKWLLVHPENRRGIELGGQVGILGENICFRGLEA